MRLSIKFTYQQADSMYCSFKNMQNMQCADFVFRCLNKTAPEVFHDHFEKVDNQKATRANGIKINMQGIWIRFY